MGGGGGGLFRAAHDRLSEHRAPDTEGAACCLHCRALRWNELSPVSPVFGGLSPVRPGTENTRQGMDLAPIRAFVPGVPGVLRSRPEGTQPDSPPQPAACGLRWGLGPMPCGLPMRAPVAGRLVGVLGLRWPMAGGWHRCRLYDRGAGKSLDLYTGNRPLSQIFACAGFGGEGYPPAWAE